MVKRTHPSRSASARFFEDRVCVYCGDYADTKDHLYPYAWTGKEGRNFVQTVWACRQCNSALSDALIPNVIARREVVRAFLRKRYAVLLSTPPWTETELAEVEGALLKYRVATDARRRVIQARLYWPALSEADQRYRDELEEEFLRRYEALDLTMRCSNCDIAIDYKTPVQIAAHSGLCGSCERTATGLYCLDCGVDIGRKPSAQLSKHTGRCFDCARFQRLRNRRIEVKPVKYVGFTFTGSKKRRRK